jgi:hypothetical protein
MAMMPSASGGSSTRTDSPFVIDHDDDSGLDNDLIDDEGVYLFDGQPDFQPERPAAQSRILFSIILTL